MLFSSLANCQLSPRSIANIPNATTAFGANVPQGSLIYNVQAGAYFYCVNNTASTFSLTTASANFYPIAIVPSSGIPVSNGNGWTTSIADNSSNWNTAFGWGDHSSPGYSILSKNETVTGIKSFGEGNLRVNNTDGTRCTILKSASAASNKTITLPNATGTVALTTDIPTDYVTQTTQQNITGQKTFNFSGLRLMNNAETYSTIINSQAASSSKTITFPNATGTVALTSDLPSASQWTSGLGGIYYNDTITLTGPYANIRLGYGNDDDPKRYSFYNGTNEDAYLEYAPAKNGLTLMNNMSSDILFGTSQGERVRLTNFGKLGIGTSAPIYNLDVIGQVGIDKGTEPSLNIGRSTTDLDKRINFWDDDNISASIESDQNTGNGGLLLSSNLIAFNTSATERFRITPSGNIGIGTTAPSVTLHVEGTSGTVNVVSTSAEGTASGASFGGYIKSLPTGTDKRLGGFKFGSRSGADVQNVGVALNAFSEGAWTSGTSHPSYFVIGTTPSAASTPIERIRITSTGLVGIGTTAPTALFQSEGGGNQFAAINTGSLAIGGGAIIGAFIKLLPTGTDQRLGVLAFGSRGGTTNNYFSSTIAGYADGAWTAGGSYPSYMTFKTTPSGTTTGAERMRISSAGYVGIGTTSPGSTLTVSGTFESSGGAINLNAASNYDVTIGSGTGTIYMGTGIPDQSIMIGTGSGIKTSYFGSNCSTSMTQIAGGEGGLFLNNNTGTSPMFLATGNSSGPITIGGTAAQTLSICTQGGTEKSIQIGNGSGYINLKAGINGLNLNTDINYPVNIAAGTSTGTVTIGGSAAQTISIGNGSATKTVAIGDNTGATSGTVLLGGSVVTNGAFNYAADAGANDTYAITLSPAPTAYATGMYVCFKANMANTGTASVNVNGLGAQTIVKRVSTTLADNDIGAGQLCLIVYNGSNFVLMNPVVN